jgi:hypothetical protein
MEVARDILRDLLGAEFPKLAGIFGFILVTLGITPSELNLRIVRIPPRDRLGRAIALAFGALCVLVPLLSAVFGNSIGLLNTAQPVSDSVATSTIKRESRAGGLLISSAIAQTRGITIDASQRSITELTQVFGGPPWALYVGDVHLSAPNVVLIFSKAGANTIKSKTNYTVDQLKRLLSKENIIVLDKLRKGDTRNFSYANSTYVLKVDAIVWYLVGDDTISFSLRKI